MASATKKIVFFIITSPAYTEKNAIKKNAENTVPHVTHIIITVLMLNIKAALTVFNTVIIKI